MNTMKKTLVVALFGMIFIPAAGQYSGQVQSNMSSGGANAGSTAQIQGLLGPINDALNKRSFNLEDFKGSPYTNNEFQKTDLFYGEEKLGPLFYRYNALNQEIEIKMENNENEGIRALGRDKKIAILVDGKKTSFKTFVDKDGKTLNGYLTALTLEGTTRLYKRHYVKYTEGKKAENSFVQAVPSKFTHYTGYFLEIEGKNRVDEIELKNKKLLNMLSSDARSSLQTFLKENKLNIKKEYDLIRAIRFLNEKPL